MRFMSNFVDGFLKEEYDPDTGELMSADVPPVGERKPQEAYYEYKRRGLTQISMPETSMTVMDRAESKRIISVMNTLTMKKEGYHIQEKKNQKDKDKQFARKKIRIINEISDDEDNPIILTRKQKKDVSLRKRAENSNNGSEPQKRVKTVFGNTGLFDYSVKKSKIKKTSYDNEMKKKLEALLEKSGKFKESF